MGFKCGIVGLPNAGKSTLFNALTSAGVAAENYPFCTVEPNVGMVPVPDTRLQRLAALVRPQTVTPTCMQFVDIAGLVKGAAQGEGLGNRFLAHIRETQAIALVLRCFEDTDVAHVEGRIDARHDYELIMTELCLADLETVTKAVSRLSGAAGAGDKQSRARLALLQPVQEGLEDAVPARCCLDAQGLQRIAELHLLTAKPLLLVANVAEQDLAADPLAELAAAEAVPCVAICARIEAEIAELDPTERREFLKELGIQRTGLERLIHAGYDLLGLQTFFTAGPKEARAWTFPRGATAPQAAGIIHTDFMRGFIRAEVITFEDYLQLGGEQQARQGGKCRSEGKDYVVQDGDVIHFRFNV